MKLLEYQGPITAIHFKGDCLYIGAGPYLKKFDWRTSQLLSSTQVFQNNKIHGIASNDRDFVMWGGRSFCFGPDFEEYTTADWIISAATHNGVIYILTAHNRVYVYNAGKVTSHALDHSILYSGTILCRENRVLIASGTVLHGVLVWDLSTQQLIHNFDQHKGSIFDVEFSSDGKYLASCSDDRCIIIWNVESGAVVAKGWGHTSRIWKLKFSSDKTRLYSISEDLTCRVWTLDNDQQELKCVDILQGHTGRNVWALDVLETPHPLICTGGQDGGIKLWTKYLLHRSERSLPIQAVLEQTALPGELYKGFSAAKDFFVATTTKGHVLKLHSDKWNTIDGENVGEYSLVKHLGKYIIICSKAGKVLVFNAQDQSHKVVQIPVSGNFSFCSGLYVQAMPHVLVQGHDLKAPIILVNLVDNRVQSLECPLGQMLTSCGFFMGQLFVGTRTGALCCSSLEVSPLSWTKIDRILDSKDAITSVLANSDDNELIVASRSGSYGLFNRNLEPVYENKLQRGSIEGMQIQENGDLLAYGFKKEYLFATNLSGDYEVFNEWCGGGHRTWSLTIDTRDEACFDMSYVKAGLLKRAVVTAPESVPTSTVLCKRTHGREIRGIEFHPQIPGLVVTVSEDTTVNIGHLDEASNFIGITSSLRKHATPPQTVHWSRDGKLLGTGGAKEEMILWELCGAKYLRPCAALPTVSDMPDLRVMDFDILEQQGGGYLIACAYSDSSLRLWSFKNKQIELLETGHYSDRCLLQAHFINSHHNEFELLVTATDGAILLFDDTLKIINKQNVHQSGVRGSVIRSRGDSIFIYSGGEDNCLAGTLLSIKDRNFTELFKIPNAHAATITDVLVEDQFIYSTGPDQKICKWTLDGGLVQAERTAISDTACLTAQNGKLIGAGLGMCIYSI